jgi:predicted DNA-binding transcriptional regulator AlpA
VKNRRVKMPPSTTTLTEGSCSVREAARLTGLSVATIYRLRAACDFPEAFPLTKGRIGFLRREVLGWIEGRAARRPPSEVV